MTNVSKADRAIEEIAKLGMTKWLSRQSFSVGCMASILGMSLKTAYIWKDNNRLSKVGEEAIWLRICLGQLEVK